MNNMKTVLVYESNNPFLKFKLQIVNKETVSNGLCNTLWTLNRKLNCAVRMCMLGDNNSVEAIFVLSSCSLPYYDLSSTTVSITVCVPTVHTVPLGLTHSF
jgi:hypothetical protein